MANKRGLRVAVVCASNMNRSMAIHNVLLDIPNLHVRSYGIANKICIPGDQPHTSNIYDFGVTYDEIFKELKQKNERVYTQIGLLQMLHRNRQLKPKPERFQDAREKFDVIVTCERKVFDRLVDFMEHKTPEEFTICHVINVDIQDSLEEANNKAYFVRDLCKSLSSSQDLDYEIKHILKAFKDSHGLPYNHKIVFN
ncbi:RNA polymerase II subunit A C-terminal domain phosphatase SSU72-like [Aethina tumida]|uniref:RNA polymerase II subunit A C-terminal domain phosphatase SSU72-like n=1 Tax=Aethina tumida TaxID=116153 RepID=UPI00096B3FA1|nr:RNA polymerase II subunit A C-terminal domain phosphatase SSU72-like [Aethina tumida]